MGGILWAIYISIFSTDAVNFAIWVVDMSGVRLRTPPFDERGMTSLFLTDHFHP